MPPYPSYRFATEFQRHKRTVDAPRNSSFLCVVRYQDGLLRAGLYSGPQATPDDDANDGVTLTDAADALNAATAHPKNPRLQEERLLIAAYQRLDHDRTTPHNVYVPADLRPWVARFRLHDQDVLLYVQAATETGARYAAMEKTRLLIRDQEDATFTRME
ncbi:MAG: hypothetical protein OXG04_28645 [Acidobacteria bacterium]|nr:hypothetical protein [Acidobacteriota bacterium]